MEGQELAPNQWVAPGLGSQSELLQQLTEVGGLGKLSVYPGQLVEDGTVEGHAGNLPLSTATAVPTDLQQLLLLTLPLPHVLVECNSDSLRFSTTP